MLADTHTHSQVYTYIDTHNNTNMHTRAETDISVLSGYLNIIYYLYIGSNLKPNEYLNVHKFSDFV